MASQVLPWALVSHINGLGSLELTGVTVRRTRSRVHPTPVSVKNDCLRARSAGAAGSAGGYRELWVCLSSESAGLLGVDNSSVGESEERSGGEHFDQVEDLCRVTDEEQQQWMLEFYT